MKTRFAPSPTGLMHFGNVRTAIFNYLYAVQQQGDFLLRIEDTDLTRSTEEYYEELLVDLAWLELNANSGPFKQSERSEIYAKYYQQLEDSHAVYPCFCSEEQLAISRKVQLASHLPPRYAGTCRKLSPTDIAAKLAQNIKPTLRFKIPQHATVEFIDLIKGKQSFKTNDLGDFIIRRQDGSASFMFCNAIDDAEMGVTHALRGDDHLANTPRQILILQALNLAIPHYGHFPMINGIDGAPLSKRNGSESIQELRNQGYLPLAVLNYLARLGHYYEDNTLMSLADLAARFDLNHINNSPARHDNTHLKHWQKETMLNLSAAQFWQLVQPLVADLIPAEQTIEFAELILPNILMPKEAIMWANAIMAEQLAAHSASNQEILTQAGLMFFNTAIEFLQTKQDASLEELLATIKTATGYKGKALFMPIRIALTGTDHGPELAKLLQFMGTSKAIARFIQAKQHCKE